MAKKIAKQVAMVATVYGIAPITFACALIGVTPWEWIKDLL